VQATATVDARWRAIAGSLCREVASRGVGGVVAIAEHGELAFVWAAGARCRSDPAAVDADTAFRIGSITKAFVAATAVSLARDGIVDLDRPLPDVGLPRPATLRQLLDHTAGLADALPDASLRGRSRDDVLHALVRDGGDTGWRYANPGYAVAAVALERASGQPWAELVHARVVEPLGLARTRARELEAVPSDTACGHLRAGETWRELDVVRDWHELAFDVDAVAPSGAMIASATDLVRFAIALSDRAPEGTPAAFADMLHAVRTKNVSTGTGDRYALGVRVRPLPDGTTLLRHAGNTGDFAADLVWVPERGFAVALLGNAGDHLRGTLATVLADAGIDPRVLATEQAADGSGSAPASPPRADPPR
jgi:CubicO group peptidase (beta-lactamase class C family)